MSVRAHTHLAAAHHARRAIAGVVLGATASLGAQSDARSFYAIAQETLQHPVAAESLRVLCTEEVRAADTHLDTKGWFSFLAPMRDSTAWIAIFTPRRIGRLTSTLSTTPRFNPLPTAQPVAGATLEWAWIWDRNGDGRVDYVAYLQNSHPLLPDPLPDSFPLPQRTPDGDYRLGREILYAMIDHATMIFRHYADDDFDGRVDAVVVEEFDASRPMFVRGWVAARSSRRDGVVDDAWAFRSAITDTTGRWPREADGTIQLPAITTDGPGLEVASNRFAHGTAVLTAINAIHARCGRAPVPLRRP